MASQPTIQSNSVVEFNFRTELWSEFGCPIYCCLQKYRPEIVQQTYAAKNIDQESAKKGSTITNTRCIDGFMMFLSSTRLFVICADEWMKAIFHHFFGENKTYHMSQQHCKAFEDLSNLGVGVVVCTWLMETKNYS